MSQWRLNAMAGLLQFVLGMDNGKYNVAVQQSNAVTLKFKNYAAAAAYETERMLKEFQKVKPPNLDTRGLENHSGSVRHLRHELGLVGEAAQTMGAQLGGISSFAGLAFNPWLLAISGIIIATQILKQKWDALRETLVKTMAVVQGQVNSRMEASVSAANEATMAITKFHIGIDESASSLDRESEAMERRIALFSALVQGQREVASAQREATDASIELAEAEGRITSIDAQRQRSNASMTASIQEIEGRNAELQNQITEKENRLREAQGGGLQRAEDAHDQAVRAAQPVHESLDTQREEIELRKKERDEALKTATEGRADSVGVMANIRDMAISTIQAQLRGGILATPEAAQNFMASKGMTNDKQQAAVNAEMELLTSQKHLGVLEREASFYDAAVEKAAKRAEIEQSVINTYQGQIDQQRELLKINQESEAKALLAKKQMADAEYRKKFTEARKFEIERLMAVTNFEKMGFNFGAGGPTSRFNHIEHNPATRAALDAVGLLKAILAAIQRGPAGAQTLANLLCNQVP